MSISFLHSEADRLAESIDRNRRIITRLQMEQEQINRSLAYHRAELDWLDRCEQVAGGADSRPTRVVAKVGTSFGTSALDDFRRAASEAVPDDGLLQVAEVIDITEHVSGNAGANLKQG